MCIKFPLEKFGVTLEPTAFITNVNLVRTWNVAAYDWVTEMRVEITIFADKTRQEQIEKRVYMIDSTAPEFKEQLLEVMLKPIYTKVMESIPDSEKDERPVPANPNAPVEPPAPEEEPAPDPVPDDAASDVKGVEGDGA